MFLVQPVSILFYAWHWWSGEPQRIHIKLFRLREEWLGLLLMVWVLDARQRPCLVAASYFPEKYANLIGVHHPRQLCLSVDHRNSLEPEVVKYPQFHKTTCDASSMLNHIFTNVLVGNATICSARNQWFSTHPGPWGLAWDVELPQDEDGPAALQLAKKGSFSAI